MKGLKRDTIDKFYTNDETVKLCIEVFKERLCIDYDNDIIIEPSAGNGSFVNEISKLCKNCKFFDIKPESKDVVEQDYLKYSPDDYLGKFRKIHIIGNPPFGRQSSTAIKFIKKSAKFCDSISFILPKSFKKDSMKSKFPLDFHLEHEADLSKNCFLLDGKEYDVPCVFQVWKKRKEKREKKVKLKPEGYIFVKKEEGPDISFRRVGGTAGTISKDYSEKSIQSHYFLKFENKEYIKLLDGIVFSESGDTVGPKSISKQEIIQKYNEIIKRYNI